MAQFNKPPTAVTIAPVHEKTGLALWVDRYWKVAVGVAAASAAALLYWQFAHQQHRERQALGWERIRDITTEDASGRLTGSPDALAALAGELKGSDAAPWASYLAASNAAAVGNYALTERLLQALPQEYPANPIAAEQFPYEEAGAASSATAELQQRALAWVAWSASRNSRSEPPKVDAEAR